MFRREMSGYSVSSYVGIHKNNGKFRGNYHSRVLVLLNFETRVIVPHRSAQSLTLRVIMSYIYMEHPFLMFLDHTQRRSTVGRTPLDE